MKDEDEQRGENRERRIENVEKKTADAQKGVRCCFAFVSFRLEVSLQCSS
jgi:hypothetical protein